jgi:hypothetical protein
VFNFQEIKNSADLNGRYQKQLERISEGGVRSTANIESTVNDSIENIQANNKSFVIYGEPQSGKTEMMISLSARLIDEGFEIILVLMNDSVDLLNQNLDRFKRSGIDPSPENYSEILDPVVTIRGTKRIIFSKKNSGDLKKLIEKVGSFKSKVIIDDEADYASPNAKINKQEKTKINELIETLIGDTGIYIGVTATPARLDLNNTFNNRSEKWVHFPPHSLYNGQETFFPTNLKDKAIEFTPHFLPDDGDEPKWLRRALINFLINVAYLNCEINQKEINYSMLVHTSGKREDHTDDYKEITKIFNILKTDIPTKTEQYYKAIYEEAEKKYPGKAEKLTKFIFDNRNRTSIVVMNSDTDKKLVDPKTATNPATLFTIAIGGNIVSRGVTFDNLLSMFFTRDVKHKIQQDTYIQRARMFGARGSYLKYFELHIPKQLYLDWHKCFVFHRLSLESIKTGNGAPVWLENKKISSVAKSSLDKTNVHMTSGEMSFGIFDYGDWIEEAFLKGSGKLEKIKSLCRTIGEDSCPEFLIKFIEGMSPYGDESIVILNTTDINAYKDADSEAIERQNGGAIRGDTAAEKVKRPNAIHYLKIFHNGKGKARLFYNYRESVKFLQNLKK